MQDNLNPTAQAEPPEASHGDGADAAPPMGLLTPSAEATAALQPDPARAAQGTLPSAGAPIQLRQAREMAGLHVAVLASMLKVPVKKLEALEAGRFDQLPDLIFARALAQSVCRQLKVDPAPILAALPQPEETWRDTSDRALSAPFVPAREMGKPTATGEPRHVSKPTVLAVVLLVAAAVLWWSLPDRGLSVSEITLPGSGAPATVTEQIMPPPPSDSDGATPLAAGSSSAAAEPAAPAALAEAAAESVVQPGSQPAAAAEAPSGAVPDAAPTAPSLAAEAVSTTAMPGEILRLSARETTWVEVLGAGGRVVVQRNLQAGESVGLSAAVPLTVVVGRADATDVQVRGQRFVLEPHTRNNVARFEVR